MAAGTLDVLVRFVADSSKVQSEAAKVEKTGSRLKTWAKGIGGAIAGAFAIDQVKKFVDAGAELQDAIGATSVIFGDASKSVIAWAGTTAESLGLSKTAALNAADTFATFGKGAGLTGKDLASFAGGLVGLSGDLASFRGTSTEQAVQAIGAALRGESEPIRAYGVMLDDATLKARAMSMGLVKSSVDQTKLKGAQLAAVGALKRYNDAVKKHGANSSEARLAGEKLKLAQDKIAKATDGTTQPLTNQQKVLAAQAEIFAQTGDAQGDFERTSDSAANQQKILKAQMEDVSSTIGTALLPVVQKLLPMVSKLAGFIQDNVTWLVPLAGYILAVAAAFKIWMLIQTLFNIQLGISAGWILIIIAAIALIAIGVLLLIRNWSKVTDALAAGWSWIKDKFGQLLEIIKAPFVAAWQWIAENAPKVLEPFKAALAWLKTNWPTVLAILTGPVGIAVLLIARNLDTIKGWISKAVSFIAGVWARLLDILTAPFRAAWDIISGITGKISGAISSALDFAGRIAGRIADALKGPINAVIRAWNRLEFKVPEVSVGPIHFGGQTIGLPDIPELAGGGYIMRTGLAVVHRGETVSTGGSSSPINVTVQVPATANPYAVGRAVVDAIRAYEGVAGTSWRMSPSGRSA